MLVTCKLYKFIAQIQLHKESKCVDFSWYGIKKTYFFTSNAIILQFVRPNIMQNIPHIFLVCTIVLVIQNPIVENTKKIDYVLKLLPFLIEKEFWSVFVK